MKVITANRLADGHPVYRAGARRWTESLGDAEILADGEAADAALAAAREEETLVVGPYLVSLAAAGAPAEREKLREDIRALGPTVRADLGRQAGEPG